MRQSSTGIVLKILEEDLADPLQLHLQLQLQSHLQLQLQLLGHESVDFSLNKNLLNTAALPLGGVVHLYYF